MLALPSVFVIAVLASALITPLVVRLAVAKGIYDSPADGRRVHTTPIPRIGGVAVLTATALSLLAAAVLHRMGGVQLWQEQRSVLLGILVGGVILFAAGLMDDLRGLRPATKIIAQCAAALVIYAAGLRVEILSLGPATELSLGWLSLPLTILWIVGVTNAFNLIDGLDGLATGIALVALGTILAVAVALGRAEVAVVCIALLGALLGFLPYNFSPARIFLGDSGSLFVGFMLAVLSVHGSLKSTTAVLVAVPLFALALPLLDASFAVARRWLRGAPLSAADARHIHHQLLAVGFTHRRAVLVLYAVAGMLAVLGLSLVFAPPTAVFAVAIAGGGACLFLLLLSMRQLQYHEFEVAGAVLASGFPRIRRVIRDQIHARDIAQIVKQADMLEQINAVLHDNAANFGFLDMEVCGEASVGRNHVPPVDAYGMRAWKLEYPLVPHPSWGEDLLVLRIWCAPGDGFRPYGAERVARILAPVIDDWLAKTKPEEPNQRTVLNAPVDRDTRTVAAS